MESSTGSRLGDGPGQIAVDGTPPVAVSASTTAYHATGRRIRSLPITLEQLL